MKKYLTKRNILLSIFALIFLILSLIICIKLLPLFTNKDEAINILKNYISNLGPYGVLLFLLIQIVQVVISIIPGEVVELLAGIFYGPWLGLLLCLIGNFIGSFLIFSLVKLFAKKETTFVQEKLSKYSFLNNKKKISLYLFIIFLIPGIPKDIITYIVPFLPINFLSFITITSIARIPSIITSTYSSQAFVNNNYITMIILIVISSLLAILGYLNRDKIIHKLKRKSENQDTSNDKDNKI